ncbi:Leucine-rich repeat receptor-like protein kinase PEPR1 [Vitis vinifera]|uniref:Leucine-rich repeat receptor-like protein kinase PEPR1 n=1 Tax=Vitis vinifera TaxID=29760 RepID=A0A438IZL7_VITVI|nr:Leucine-rich repeat receptor-like protein kinase PEPR1 [Vitis vinifera]
MMESHPKVVQGWGILSGSWNDELGNMESSNGIRLHEGGSKAPDFKECAMWNLPHHKLSGSISPDIGKLELLKLLALQNNNFYGTIPSELGNCTELQALRNKISSAVPRPLKILVSLEIKRESCDRRFVGTAWKFKCLEVVLGFFSVTVKLESEEEGFF